MERHLPQETQPPGEGWHELGCASLPRPGVIETWDSTLGLETAFAVVTLGRNNLLTVRPALRKWWREA